MGISVCLWTYARTRHPRKSLFQPNGRTSVIFEANRQLFGPTAEAQRRRLQLDKHAYYALLDINSVLFPVPMTPLFVGDTYTYDHTTWLETVTLL